MNKLLTLKKHPRKVNDVEIYVDQTSIGQHVHLGENVIIGENCTIANLSLHLTSTGQV